MHFRTLILVLSCCFIGNTVATESSNAFTIYLVRHAEKQTDGGKDPRLTQAGVQRAEQLAVWFQDKRIKDVWSSDYHRTRDTAKPLAARSSLEMRIYDPRKLTKLAEGLIENQTDAVIVGHSNTTPDLARLLCNCEIDDMNDSEYDRIILVSFLDGKTQVQTARQTASTVP